MAAAAAQRLAAKIISINVKMKIISKMAMAQP